MQLLPEFADGGARNAAPAALFDVRRHIGPIAGQIAVVCSVQLHGGAGLALGPVLSLPPPVRHLFYLFVCCIELTYILSSLTGFHLVLLSFFSWSEVCDLFFFHFTGTSGDLSSLTRFYQVFKVLPRFEVFEMFSSGDVWFDWIKTQLFKIVPLLPFEPIGIRAWNGVDDSDRVQPVD